MFQSNIEYNYLNVYVENYFRVSKFCLMNLVDFII